MSSPLPVYAFDAQRAQCLACTHHRAVQLSHRLMTHQSLRCAVVNHQGCSLVRAVGGKCGPDAVLFKSAGVA